MTFPFSINQSQLIFNNEVESARTVYCKNNSDEEMDIKITCLDERFSFDYPPSFYSPGEDNYRLSSRSYCGIKVKFTPSANSTNKSAVIRFHFQKESTTEWSTQYLELPVKIVREKPTPLECPICYEAYAEDVADRTPRILKECGHTVCEKCVRDLLYRRWSQRIRCPHDQKVTEVDKGDVKNLPRNYVVLEALRDSLNTPSIPCEENSRHTAVFFCLSCAADYCEQCYDDSHKTKVFSKHQKVPISEKPIQLPKCPKHTYNNAEFLCKNPDCGGFTVICHTCILGNHKDHPYENLMEKLIENEKKGADMLENAELIKNNIEKELSATRDIQETYTLTKDFEKKSQEIRDYYKSLEWRDIGKLKGYCHDNYNELTRHCTMLETSLKAVNGFIKEMDGMVKSKKNLHLVGEKEPELNELTEIPVAKTHKKLEDVKITWNNGGDVSFD